MSVYNIKYSEYVPFYQISLIFMYTPDSDRYYRWKPTIGTSNK